MSSANDLIAVMKEAKVGRARYPSDFEKFVFDVWAKHLASQVWAPLGPLISEDNTAIAVEEVFREE